jgi:penicillin-binding protein A
VPLAILTRLPVTRDVVEAVPTAPADPEELTVAHPGDFVLTPDDRLVEWVDPPASSELHGPLRVEYTLDAELMRRVFDVLRDGRVRLGHVIVMDASDGRVRAYASTDLDAFPPTRTYPVASLIKVVTAAAALRHAPLEAHEPCVFLGSPYRLTRARLTPPRRGRSASLESALAASNNQCFARLAVHALGGEALMRAIRRFGLLEPAGPGHAPGHADPGEDDLELGKLGSGLGGAQITPLHAVQLAATLARGELVRPRWVEAVSDADDRPLSLPWPAPGRRVMSPALSAELREMLVRTTTSGTARHAFRDRRGRPLLGEVKVAGKTGSLTGSDPPGHYQWFIAVAPAERPRVAIAVLEVHGDRWWRTAAQIGASVLREIFCDGRVCRDELAGRYLPSSSDEPGEVADTGPRSTAAASGG